MCASYLVTSLNTFINCVYHSHITSFNHWLYSEKMCAIRCSNVSADDIADLNDRLIGLQQAKDAEKEQYEGELQKLRNEFQETKDQLTSENMILSEYSWTIFLGAVVSVCDS